MAKAKRAHQHATGANGHSGPHGQIGPNGLQAHDPETEQDQAQERPKGRPPLPNAPHATPSSTDQPDEPRARPHENGTNTTNETEGANATGGANGTRRANRTSGTKGASGKKRAPQDGDPAAGVPQDGAPVAEGPQGGTAAAEGPQDGDPAAGVPQAGTTAAEGPQDGASVAEGPENGTSPYSRWTASRRAPRPNGRAEPAGFGTPVRVDEIAVAALALSEDLQAATKDLPESIDTRGFRRDLDRAADTFRAIASELEATAGNLVRLAATEGRTCDVTWGVCPEHGLTVMSAGEVATCHVLGCYRQHEGPLEPCPQPVAYKVVDVGGPALHACAGHAIACRLHFEGAVITLASDSLELF